MSIEVSTHQIGEQTCSALSDKATLDEVLSVWHALGKVIKGQLTQRKGTKLPSFGTFSLSTKGDPVFALANEFAQQFKVKQKAQAALDNIPTNILNFAQIAAATEIPRDKVDKIYAKFISCIGRFIFEGRGILLTVHRIAEIKIGKGEVSCSFIPDFLRLFEKTDTKLGGTQRELYREVANKTSNQLAADQFEKNLSNSRKNYQENTFQIGNESQGNNGRKEIKRASSATRARNPILGDESETSSRPSSAGKYMQRAQQQRGGGGNNNYESRRPGSARSYGSQPTMSTLSIMDSPRFNSNNRSSGLRKEQLDRHNATKTRQGGRPSSAHGGGGGNGNTNTIVDARKIAAKALDGGDIIDRVRARIIERGGSNGIRSITKLLQIMDDNGDHKLSKDELKYGLRDYGIDLTPTELEQVFLYFDRDGNGFIDCTEFLVGIRGEMNERRRKMVRMAFNILDKDGSGVIDVDEILAAYDLNWHPEVRAGKKTVKEAAKDFMSQWEKNRVDGEITLQDFEDYYKEISASIDDDNYFELMIRNAWRIAGGEGAAANTANRRVLVTNKDGTQTVQTINNELGIRGNDVKEMRSRLKQQGVDADNIELYGGMDTRDKAKTDRRPGIGNSNSNGNRRDHSNTNVGYSPRPGAGGGGNRPSNPTGHHRNSGGGGGHGHHRSSNNNNDMWAAPRGGGDECLPEDDDYDYDNSNRRGSSSGGRHHHSNNNNDKFNPYDTLKKYLYTPPHSIEQLCAKLQISSVNPRIAMGAFHNRLASLDPTLSRDELKTLWSVFDTKNIGVVDAETIHGVLSSRFGKDKVTNKNSGVIEKVIKKILERSGESGGIKGLQRTLSIMDDNGDKKLTKEELKTGLADYGIELNIRELDDIFGYFDRDRNGFVDVDEFFIGIKGDLNPRRTKLVKMAFDILDKDGSGYITVEEMLDVYDFSKHPEVMSGKKTPKEAMREFMKQWDDPDGDGSVSYGEFEDYYKGVSASIDGDDYFELMIRNAWRIAGGEGAAANTANRRVLVTNKDGTQTVQTINNELGIRGNDVKEMRSRLKQQGVDADNIELYGGMDTRDKAKTDRRPGGAGGGSGRGPQRGDQSLPPRHGNSHHHNNNNNNSKSRTSRSQHNNNHHQEESGRDAFSRHMAAAKLAAAYRGRLGRKKAEQEKRKVDAEYQRREEEEAENNRPKPKQILRPKGKSYIGF